jgi:hypothetical protein
VEIETAKKAFNIGIATNFQSELSTKVIYHKTVAGQRGDRWNTYFREKPSGAQDGVDEPKFQIKNNRTNRTRKKAPDTQQIL